MDDPLLVEVQAEDFWYEGYNMRTGARGVFPAYYAIEVSKEPEPIKKGEGKEKPGVMGLGLPGQGVGGVQVSSGGNVSWVSLSSRSSEKRRLGGEVQPEIPGICPGSLPQRERGAVCCHAEGW